MTASPYVRANAAPDASRWRTFDGPVVLAVARTFTSTVRILESLATFRGDTRVLIVFACDDTSAFNAGTRELLSGLNACVVPWEHRLNIDPALVVTATENTDLSEFSCPVVVLPHGVGFQKYVPDHRTDEVRLSGVPRAEFQHFRHVHLVLSHPAQREQLRRAGVPMAEWAEVVGDLTRDRIVGSVRLREEYRAHLQVGEDQRLVVVSSTWGRTGLIGRRPRLPHALVGALPSDGYRVATILHPNVWFAHSPWQVEHMLADAQDAGLLLIPPESGWGASLVAADCVIGDHGSVTLYGAMMDRPVLLAAMGEDSVPGTAAAELARRASRLETEGLRSQVERAIETHRPGQYAEAADLAFAYPGRGGHRLADLLYGLLGLRAYDRGAADRLLPGPTPTRSHRAPTSFEVHGSSTATDEVRIERFPAAPQEFPEPAPGTFRHRSAYENEHRNQLVTSASVVCRSSRHGADSGVRDQNWTQHALSRYHGAFAVASPVHEGSVVALRDGRSYLVRGVPDGTLPLAAAVVYTLVRAHGEPAGMCKVHVTGQQPWECRIDPVHTPSGAGT
ncbi:hypothetical protein [Nocardiopsis kunsanensis]|uniref:hypothetical protein n=1 Tax=Nocardiopsis kunsanensis TaxID=141693 RepID=UPI0003496C8E|nr:hypothetical protein [Nocardiopsis kunsanensis]